MIETLAVKSEIQICGQPHQTVSLEPRCPPRPVPVPGLPSPPCPPLPAPAIGCTHTHAQTHVHARNACGVHTLTDMHTHTYACGCTQSLTTHAHACGCACIDLHTHGRAHAHTCGCAHTGTHTGLLETLGGWALGPRRPPSPRRARLHVAGVGAEAFAQLAVSVPPWCHPHRRATAEDVVSGALRWPPASPHPVPRGAAGLQRAVPAPCGQSGRCWGSGSPTFGEGEPPPPPAWCTQGRPVVTPGTPDPFAEALGHNAAHSLHFN